MDRETARAAKRDALTVFDPEGTEVLVTHVHNHFPSAIVEYNAGNREVFRLDELTLSTREV